MVRSYGCQGTLACKEGGLLRIVIANEDWKEVAKEEWLIKRIVTDEAQLLWDLVHKKIDLAAVC